MEDTFFDLDGLADEEKQPTRPAQLSAFFVLDGSQFSFL